MNGPVRLSDVAARANVSIATASRVLNGGDRQVGEPFRRRVLDAANELGYTANANAQAMARGASNILGLVVHDITDPYFSTIAAAVTGQAEEQGMAVFLANTRRQAELEVDYVAMMRAQRARAVIIVGSRYAGRKANDALAAEIERFTAAGGRAACVSQNRLGVDTVVPQNHAGARSLAESLLDLGHRKFVILAGPKDLLTARDRLRGFEAAVAAHGEARCRVIHGPFTRDGGYMAAREVIDLGFDETCLFAVNDVMAVGAMAAMRDHQVDVPGQISVAGFDDIETLRDLLPSLTTVRLPLADMGLAVAAMAMQPVELPPRTIKVDGEVVLRDSTRPLD